MPLRDYYEIGSGAGPGLVFGATLAEGISNAVTLYLKIKEEKRKTIREEEKDRKDRELKELEVAIQYLTYQQGLSNDESKNVLAKEKNEIESYDAETRRMKEKRAQREWISEKIRNRGKGKLEKRKALAEIEKLEAERDIKLAEKKAFDQGTSPKIAQQRETWEAKDRYEEEKLANKIETLADRMESAQLEVDTLKQSRRLKLPNLSKEEINQKVEELEDFMEKGRILLEEDKQYPGRILKRVLPELPSYVLPKKLKLSPRVTRKGYDYSGGQPRRFAFRQSPPSVSSEPSIYPAMREKVGYNY